jgi:hypothetical protein
MFSIDSALAGMTRADGNSLLAVSASDIKDFEGLARRQ